MAYSREQLIALVQQTAQAYGLDQGIAVRQIQAESNFNPNAVSPVGAQGIAQFMPGTWKQYGSGSPFDPAAAMQAWAKYMTHLLQKFGGNYGYALAGYNWGEYRDTLENGYKAGKPVLSLNLPDETRKYVTKILGAGAAPSGDVGNADNGESSGLVQYWPLAAVLVGLWWLLDD